MHDDKESPYTLTLLNSELSLHVLQFTGVESLNQPYRFDIEVIGLASTLAPERLLEQPAFLRLSADAGIHGVIHSAAREHRGQHRIGYTLVLVPHLQNLDGVRCRRVFHQLDVPSLLRQLLVENAVPASSYRFELPTARYPVRPFCIQFEETDLAFLQRLCEEEGIHFHFVHRRDDHVLVFADDSLSFPQEPLLMPFQPESAQPEDVPIISELFQRHGAPPPMTHPAPDLLHREQLSRRILQRLRCRQRQIQGQSNQRELSSGRIVQVSHHPLTSFNDQWLLTDVRHQGQQPSILDGHSAATRGYCNHFSAIPWSTEFRPAVTRARPTIPGYQKARVAGPMDQPAQRDERGRIAVILWPDCASDFDEPGLWVPVALATPDAHLDSSRWPVGGAEVLISFLDSDPDRPVVCATADHRPAPPATRVPGGDDRLLLDWLINR